jgi:hypothetical protein
MYVMRMGSPDLNRTLACYIWSLLVLLRIFGGCTLLAFMYKKVCCGHVEFQIIFYVEVVKYILLSKSNFSFLFLIEFTSYTSTNYTTCSYDKGMVIFQSYHGLFQVFSHCQKIYILTLINISLIHNRDIMTL